ncbi:hypothetical protein F4821DRAFT_168165 [Hypoxylon rubiginosum]|uniref:Uncharacterized protein n=1 Tax=Hypoxylon rubiginosum TaxID=110542 RepID=A0ACC0CVS3_9PEZI|nr:hypothetical protein F4821DRAFT_168165 [Hypoxylon rubiginosum]
MNQLRLVSAAKPTAMPPNIIRLIDRSRFSIRTLPRQLTQFSTTHAKSPFVAIYLKENVPVLNNGDRYKASYTRRLDGELEGVNSDLHLEYLRREHQFLQHRQRLIERRGCMDVGCEKALETMSRILKWGSEVLTARITQLETREEKLKSTGEEGSSKSEK